MEMNFYLQSLLFDQECVIIPDFGGFVSNYRPAEIRENTRSIIPPSKEIRFNKNLNRNDGLLINYIASDKNIPYSDAKDIVERAVEEIQTTLEKGNEITFTGIGKIYFDKHKILLFEPDTRNNFLTDSFGLSSLTFTTFGQEVSYEYKKKKHEINTATGQSERTYQLKKVLIGIPVVLLLSFLPFKMVKENVKPNMASLKSVFSEMMNTKPSEVINNPESVDKAIDQMTNLKVALFYEEAKQDIQNKEELKPISEPVSTSEQSKNLETTEIKTEEVQPKTEPKLDEKESVLTKIIDQGPTFFIIAGSFKNRNEASAWSGNLTSKGLSIEILEPENGNHRISVGSYKNRADADARLQELRSRNISTWILTKN